MEVLNHAVEAELAVLHEQDAFHVEELIDELKTRMLELEKQVTETT